MQLWIRLALRNATRNRRRTMLTAATVLLACAMLTVALSWLEGVFGGITRAHTVNNLNSKGRTGGETFFLKIEKASIVSSRYHY